jgi:phosphatidylglycerol---prolipoprotein diacylglyceryl transferase
MYPELFTVQLYGYEWTVMSYSFFYVCAVLLVIFGGALSTVRRGFTFGDSIIMIGTMSFFGFVGARLLHFVLNPSIYATGRMNIFEPHMTGFTIVGGIAFAVIAGVIVGKFIKIDLWLFADRLIPSIAFAIVFARIGCYLNGCCFGHPTDSFFGVQFPFFSEAHKFQISQGFSNIFSVMHVHPTQLYELCAAFIGGIVTLFMIKKKMFTGAAVLFFGMFFSAFRFINIFFRETPDSLILSVRSYGIIYVVIFIFCMSIFIIRMIKSAK